MMRNASFERKFSLVLPCFQAQARKRAARPERRGFTLIELLISIAIIGILLTLLIPNIDRSLSKNDLANDAELFKSKVEETRLMAGSTQQIDAQQGLPNQDGSIPTAYYAIHIPPNPSTFFSIIRVSYPVSGGTMPCTISKAIDASNNIAGSDQSCVVQRITLSRKVTIVNSADRLILFRVPTQQVGEGKYTIVTSTWSVINPDFTWQTSNPFKLKLDTKYATLGIEAYTAKITISY